MRLAQQIKRAFLLDVRFYCGTWIGVAQLAIVEAGPNSGFILNFDSAKGPPRIPHITLRTHRIDRRRLPEDNRPQQITYSAASAATHSSIEPGSGSGLG